MFMNTGWIYLIYYFYHPSLYFIKTGTFVLGNLVASFKSAYCPKRGGGGVGYFAQREVPLGCAELLLYH